ncbi:MAG TPA: glutamine--fructose-6-phosphate transaminase (isomerizing) [Candidatus Saccharimonadales bacterium]|nr:glutamine--fructose-6-phosphate transaminase (isomerizing) [Candidatus Saccharimonadales bacterium]
MCGIVGYLGKKPAVPILLSGLKRLEYRGYDSAGICVAEKQALKIFKKEGPIKNLEADLNQQTINSQIGIAHTRWATHGQPNKINAHPHYDCQHQIAVVHNGIIENFEVLKILLEKEGHKIISETDSEIIAHLIEKFYHDDLEKAVLEAVKLLEGTFGLAVMAAGEHKIVAARRGSPLILGLGQDEVFVASDASAIIEYTKQVIYLEDNEIAVISDSGYEVKSLDGHDINNQVTEIQWTIAEIEKGGFEYFMLKEIFEQPKTIANALRGRIKDGKIKLSVNFDPQKVDKIIITACGTSWHSALIGKYLLEKIAGIPTEVDYASEFRYRNPIVRPNNLLIVISQSGETADTLAALRETKDCETLGIINSVGSTIAREVKSGIYLHAGPEIGVASTKAFTSQVASLIMLALYLKEKISGDGDDKLSAELLAIPEKIQAILNQAEVIKEISQNFVSAKNLLYLGRGINFPVALEGALKLKEVSYIHAEGYPAAEMKHGPIALIDKNMFVVFIVNHGPIFEKIISNMQEVRARGGRIIAITDTKDAVIEKLSEFIITVPSVSEELSPLINIIPLQLMSYYVAHANGINVDKPRNLAKSVTVE